MSQQTTAGKYFVKDRLEGGYFDIANMFEGVNVLKVDGMASRGKAVNVYNEQWVNSEREDFMIAGTNGKIIRAHQDITITFIVGRKYADDNQWIITRGGTTQCNVDDMRGGYESGAVTDVPKKYKITTNVEVTFYRYIQNQGREVLGTGTEYINNTGADINAVYFGTDEPTNVKWFLFQDKGEAMDEQTIYDSFVDFMTSSDVWFASTYNNLEVHCICTGDIKPKLVKIQRGVRSYIIGEITLHPLEPAAKIEMAEEEGKLVPVIVVYPPCYYGFSDDVTFSSLEDMEAALAKEERTTMSGSYTLTAQENGYLWFCVPTNLVLSKIMAYGFQVPIEIIETGVSGYVCYRSSYEIKAGTYTFIVNPNI